MFTLAHFSDPHLPLPPAGAGQLLSKRLTGFLSWQLRRRHIHVPRALAAIVEDIRDIAPDHIALTGDIANISLPSEFEQAADWLASVAPPDRMTVVPGNHDLYVPLAWDTSLARWGHYMAGDGRAPPASPDDFPFVRRRGPVALIGLSTAVPTRPLIAQGTLGAGQLDRLGAILADLGRENLCRVVLIHHPPQQGGASWRKGLTDAAGFRAVLARAGAELVLHGHNHRSEIGAIAGPTGNVPVLGVISASAAPDSPYGRAGWHRIAIERTAGTWRIAVEHRAIDADCRACHVQSTFVFQSGGFPHERPLLPAFGVLPPHGEKRFVRSP
jgi:3',5'-cyclic AMP phosphodiesterase CpdA